MSFAIHKETFSDPFSDDVLLVTEGDAAEDAGSESDVEILSDPEGLTAETYARPEPEPGPTVEVGPPPPPEAAPTVADLDPALAGIESVRDLLRLVRASDRRRRQRDAARAALAHVSRELERARYEIKQLRGEQAAREDDYRRQIAHLKAVVRATREELSRWRTTGRAS